MEKDKRKKNVERVLLVIGSMVSLYLGYCLMTYHVEANIVGKHISYTNDYPGVFRPYGSLFYIIATIVPPFFSTIKKMWTLAVAILISYIITFIFYTDYIVSVWCFFASVISITVYGLLYEMRNLSNRLHNGTLSSSELMTH